MRKTQSYQEPSVHPTELKTSSVSNSHEFKRPVRLSADIDLFPFKQSSHTQPLFEIKQNGNIQRPQFQKSKMSLFERSPDENYMVRSLNTNPNTNTNLKQSSKNHTQLTARMSHNIGEESNPYRPSFNQLRKNDNSKGFSQQIQGYLFTKHLNKLEKEKAKQNNISYKLNFAYRSNKGYSGKPDKVNQDAYIINLNLDKNEQINFFGVCDGHGPLGHHVSGFLKNYLTESNKSFNSKGKIKEQIFQMLKIADQKLTKQSKIDLSYSGSTLVGCYICSDRIYCSNVGDSRAIIGSKGKNQKRWSVWQISTDHKPCLKSQADRIIKKDGRINAIQDREGRQVGPLRVWLKNEDTPGLAMTRSFGDLVASRVGVHSQPEITQHFLSESDRIVLIASDGIWQFLSNEDIINKLAPFYQKNQLEEACNFLQQYAKAQWISQNHGQIDDISFVLIFLFHS